MMYSQRCKWSNDGCNNNSECCSRKCERLHPGTNHRCKISSMRQPCLSGFHCDSRLKCGMDYVCCSGLWGTCSESADCCEHDHVCRKMKGFIYRKCLPLPRTLLLPRNNGQARDKLILYRSNTPTLYIMAMLLEKLAVGLLSMA